MQFTKFAVGSGTLADVSTITSLTELITSVKDFAITKVDKETATQVKVQGLFKNTDVTEGFYLREIGLYAKDLETEAEILFAYINYGNNAEFVNNTVDAKEEFHYDLDIAVGNAENIEIVINSEASYVTDKDLEELKEKYYKKIIETETSIITLPWYYKVGANMLRVLHEGQELEEASAFAGLDGYWLPITAENEIAPEGTWTNKIQCNEGWTWLPRCNLQNLSERGLSKMTQAVQTETTQTTKVPSDLALHEEIEALKKKIAELEKPINVVVGEEFKTGKLRNGKTEYCKIISCGVLPNNSEIKIPIGFSAKDNPIHLFYGITQNSSNGAVKALPHIHNKIIDMSIQLEIWETNVIYIRCNTDYSSFNKSYVYLYYTKNSEQPIIKQVTSFEENTM